jgi:hypothetical protein
MVNSLQRSVRAVRVYFSSSIRMMSLTIAYNMHDVMANYNDEIMSEGAGSIIVVCGVQIQMSFRAMSFQGALSVEAKRQNPFPLALVTSTALAALTHTHVFISGGKGGGGGGGGGVVVMERIGVLNRHEVVVHHVREISRVACNGNGE